MGGRGECKRKEEGPRMGQGNADPSRDWGPKLGKWTETTGGLYKGIGRR